MRIAVLCGTQRGHRFLRKLVELRPEHELTVFSFPEEPWEPPFCRYIRELTEAAGGTFFETANVASPRWRWFWDATPPDLMFLVSWRYRIPAEIYSQSRLGTFVFHDSLLPEYRGFSPTVWAILNGENHTGVTLFAIADDIDAGDIIDQERVPIGPDDYIADVMERVTQQYLILLERNLPRLMEGDAPRRPQDHSRATHACKRLLEDNRITWHEPSRKIYDLIRATSRPYTGAYTHFSRERLRVWSAQPVPEPGRYAGRVPGRIVEVRRGEGSVVLTGDGALLLTSVQQDGGEACCAAEILNSLSHTLV